MGPFLQDDAAQPAASAISADMVITARKSAGGRDSIATNGSV